MRQQRGVFGLRVKLPPVHMSSCHLSSCHLSTCQAATCQAATCQAATCPHVKLPLCLSHTVEASLCRFLLLTIEQKSCKYHFLLFLVRPNLESNLSLCFKPTRNQNPSFFERFRKVYLVVHGI